MSLDLHCLLVATVSKRRVRTLTIPQSQIIEDLSQTYVCPLSLPGATVALNQFRAVPGSVVPSPLLFVGGIPSWLLISAALDPLNPKP